VTLITVGQDNYAVIGNTAGNKDVYVTDQLADCYVFGITYWDAGVKKALFGHFSQNYFKGSGKPQPNGAFNSMMEHCSGKDNVSVEAVTNFHLGTTSSIKHVREALGEYGGDATATFYLASLNVPYVTMYFYPENCILLASKTKLGKGDMEYHQDFFKDHNTPRFCTAFGTGTQKQQSTCCVIL
jgi:hypothetical protein